MQRTENAVDREMRERNVPRPTAVSMLLIRSGRKPHLIANELGVSFRLVYAVIAGKRSHEAVESAISDALGLPFKEIVR